MWKSNGFCQIRNEKQGAFVNIIPNFSVIFPLPSSSKTTLKMPVLSVFNLKKHPKNALRLHFFGSKVAFDVVKDHILGNESIALTASLIVFDKTKPSLINVKKTPRRLVVLDFICTFAAEF